MSLGVKCGCAIPPECQGQPSPSLKRAGRVPAFAGIPSAPPPPDPISPCEILESVTFTYENQQEEEFTVTLINEINSVLSELGFSLESVVFTSGEQPLALSLNSTDPSPCYEQTAIQGVVNGELQTLYFVNNATS